MKHKSLKLALGLALGIAGASLVYAAETPQPVERFNGTTLWFESWGSLSKATLIVEGPEGNVWEFYTESGAPKFQLEGDGKAVDGIYRYELTAATTEKQKIKRLANTANNGRGENASDTASVAFYMNGVFSVVRGVITAIPDINE